MGQRDGIWKVYNDEGSHVETVTYANGKILKDKKHSFFERLPGEPFFFAQQNFKILKEEVLCPILRED